MPPPPISTVSPSTTLFRSVKIAARLGADQAVHHADGPRGVLDVEHRTGVRGRDLDGRVLRSGRRPADQERSDEHTSEVQSLRHRVYRLVLEERDVAGGQWL